MDARTASQQCESPAHTVAIKECQYGARHNAPHVGLSVEALELGLIAAALAATPTWSRSFLIVHHNAACRHRRARMQRLLLRCPWTAQTPGRDHCRSPQHRPSNEGESIPAMSRSPAQRRESPPSPFTTKGSPLRHPPQRRGVPSVNPDPIRILLPP